MKSVIQSLPTYAMSVFMLPAEIKKELERTITKFWWRSKVSDMRGIQWMNWERLANIGEGLLPTLTT